MKNLKQIIPIFIVLFLGYLGFSLALPLFAPLFLDLKQGFLSPEISVQTRQILLGILLSMYPLGQFLGAPILGKYSDKYGRKPILLTSLLLIIPTYIGCALSVLYTLPLLLFISRFLCGLLEGNIVIAQAAISDISEDKKAKTKNFGLFVSLSSTAFFFGPLIGGKLADSEVIEWFHYDTPFWCATLLVVIAFFTVYFLYNETHIPDKEVDIKFKTVIKSFVEGFKSKNLRPLFVRNFFVFLALFFFLNFLSPYLVNTFAFTPSSLGEVNAYLALSFIFPPLLFGTLSKYWSPQQILMGGSFLLALSYLIFILPSTPWALFGTLPPIGCFSAIAIAFPIILVSNQVENRSQGQALGTNTSIQVFTEAITAISGGFLMILFNALPILAGAICGCIGGILLIGFRPVIKHH